MVPSRREFLSRAKRVGVAALMAKPAVSRFSKQQVSAVQRAETVRTPVLDIGYEEHGTGEGFPILLLHGFPYDVRSWDGVVPSLVKRGYRVLVPYLRGYGPTKFRDRLIARTAEQAALGQDVIDFADALKLQAFALAGFDWGNRAACITAILHPERVRAQVAIGGYSVQDTVTSSAPASVEIESRLWYQWYFNTERGRRGLETNRRDICRHLWTTWSPRWRFSDETFDRTAVSFDNPDFVDVVIHSYRHRHRNALGEKRFLKVEKFLAEQPRVLVPTIVLRGAESGFGRPSPDPSRDETRFGSLVARRIIEGAGHDLPVQRPEAVSDALAELLA